MTPCHYGYVRRATRGVPPHLWLASPYERREAAQALRARVGAGRWDPEARVWRYPLLHPEGQMEQWLRELLPDAVLCPGGAGDIEEDDGLVALAHGLAPAQYEWRRPPYEHQRITVAATRRRDRILVLDEMGLGKTQAAVDAACVAMRAGDVERAVIICPTSMRDTWRQEIAAVASIDPDDVALVRNNPPARSGERMRGADNREHREYQLRRHARWTVLHYPVVRLHLPLLQELVAGQFLILDESQKIKSRDAAVTRAILALEPRKVIAQTGTPLENSPQDLWPMLALVAPELAGNYYRFRNRYCIVRRVPHGRGSFELVTGGRNLGELRRKLQAVGLRRRKADVLNLPPKVRQSRLCEMGEAQAAAYAEMRDHLQLFFRDWGDADFVVRARTVYAQLLRLAQLADGYASASPERVAWFDEVGKLEALLEIAEEVCSERKMVVWSRFVPAGRRIAEVLKDYHPVRLAGEVPEDERQALVERFRRNEECRVLVGQYQTAGLGLNLQVANCVVLYDLWWNPAVVEQAIDRCHRVGQHHPVDVVTLLSEDSIDQYVQRLLDRKTGWAQAVTGPAEPDELDQFVPRWSRDDVMAALSLGPD